MVAAIGRQCIAFVLIYAAVCVLMVWCPALVHKTLGSKLLEFIAIAVVIRREFCTSKYVSC
jgi:hypothetical protein